MLTATIRTRHGSTIVLPITPDQVKQMVRGQIRGDAPADVCRPIVAGPAPAHWTLVEIVCEQRGRIQIELGSR